MTGNGDFPVNPVPFRIQQVLKMGMPKQVSFCPRTDATTAKLSCPERQLLLQNYGKPTFLQPTAQGQLLGSTGKGRDGGKGVGSRTSPFRQMTHWL